MPMSMVWIRARQPAPAWDPLTVYIKTIRTINKCSIKHNKILAWIRLVIVLLGGWLLLHHPERVALRTPINPVHHRPCRPKLWPVSISGSIKVVGWTLFFIIFVFVFSFYCRFLLVLFIFPFVCLLSEICCKLWISVVSKTGLKLLWSREDIVSRCS